MRKLILLCLNLGLLLTFDLSVHLNAQPTASVFPTSHVFLPLMLSQAGSQPFGIQLLGGETNPPILALARSAGIQWARVYVSWASIEPSDTTPQNYNWGNYDAVFANLASYGLIPIVTIEGNPGWASSCGRCPIDRAPLSEFAEFVSALVARYKGSPYNVKYWEFYNEPDDWEIHPWDGTPGAWGGKGAQYAEMLKAVWPAVHNTDPDGKVVLGGLAYDWWSSCYPCFDLNFLDDIVANGGGPYFDIMNFHYYPRLGSKWNPPTVVGKALALRSKLPADLRGKPIMCTEFGEPYEGETQDPPYSHEIASRYVVQAFVHSMSTSDYAFNWLTTIWFSMEYYEHGPRRFGLLDAGLNPQPEYHAYQTMTRELSGASYARRLNVSGIEGYVFSMPGGGEKRALWSSGGTKSVSFAGSRLRIVDKYGVESFVSDGGAGDGDGAVNGQVRINVGESPIYVSESGSSPTSTPTPTATPTPTSTATPTPVATTAQLPLTTSWNLISIPLSPPNTAITQVLSSIVGRYDLVYAYNACDTTDPWKKFDPNAPPFVNDLANVGITQGLWVRAVTGTTLYVFGTVPGTITIQLCAGWNLIGYPSQNPVALPEALASIAGKYNLVYAYDASDAADPWKKYDPTAPPFVNDLTQMRSGVGYWIRVTATATLIIN